MTKEKKLIILTLLIIAALLIYCWFDMLTTENIATWRHYSGLVLFLVIVLLYFRSIRIATIATGAYLLLATFNLAAITTEIETSWITIGPISTPPIQLMSFGLFILYFLMNIDALINIYLDYKEHKNLKS